MSVPSSEQRCTPVHGKHNSGLLSWIKSRKYMILSVIATIATWEFVANIAGTNNVGAPMVPGIEGIVGAVPLLANYWVGGFGVESVAAGGEVTWKGVVLGLLYNTGVTALHLVVGLTTGIVAGVGLAVLVSYARVIRLLCELPAHFSRMMPLLALIPLFAFWFGATSTGAILFITYTTFVIIFAIALNAIGNVPQYYSLYAQCLGASRLRTYLEVVLPAALPETTGGILMAVAFGGSSAIAAEYLGHQHGLGHIVQNAQFFGRMSLLALTAVIIVVMAITLYGLARAGLNWLTRWAE